MLWLAPFILMLKKLIFQQIKSSLKSKELNMFIGLKHVNQGKLLILVVTITLIFYFHIKFHFLSLQILRLYLLASTSSLFNIKLNPTYLGVTIMVLSLDLKEQILLYAITHHLLHIFNMYLEQKLFLKQALIQWNSHKK